MSERCDAVCCSVQGRNSHTASPAEQQEQNGTLVRIVPRAARSAEQRPSIARNNRSPVPRNGTPRYWNCLARLTERSTAPRPSRPRSPVRLFDRRATRVADSRVGGVERVDRGCRRYQRWKRRQSGGLSHVAVGNGASATVVVRPEPWPAVPSMNPYGSGWQRPGSRRLSQRRQRHRQQPDEIVQS